MEGTRGQREVVTGEEVTAQGEETGGGKVVEGQVAEEATRGSTSIQITSPTAQPRGNKLSTAGARVG